MDTVYGNRKSVSNPRESLIVYVLRQQRVPHLKRCTSRRCGWSGREASVLSRAVVVACLAVTALPQVADGQAAAEESYPDRSTCPEPLELLVERRLAESQDLESGSRLSVAALPDSEGCPAIVAGVYEPEADPSELARDRRRIVLHLPDLADLAGREDEVDRFSVLLKDPGEADAVAARIGALMPGTRALGGTEVAARASTTFEVVRRFHRAIGLITITAGGVFLACIMTLKVQERRSQVAALRLVGISNRTLLSWLMLEAALVSVIGGLLGIGIGRLASSTINAWYQRVYATTLEFSIVTRETVAIGLVLAVVLGLVAGGVGAVRLLQVDALEEVGR
jgi:putative ABC transport system permease protein